MYAKYLKQYSVVIVVMSIFTLAGCMTTKNKASPEVEDQATAFDEFKEQLVLTVEDSKREEILLNTIDALELDINALLAEIKNRKQGFKELNANYNASREEFDAFFDDANRKIQLQRKQTSIQYRLIQELLTEQEQKQLNRHNNKLIESFINSLNAT